MNIPALATHIPGIAVILWIGVAALFIGALLYLEKRHRSRNPTAIPGRKDFRPAPTPKSTPKLNLRSPVHLLGLKD